MSNTENVLNNSILSTIKKMLGFESEYEAFDEDLVVLINGIIRELYQLGVGEECFALTGSEQTWIEYLGGTSGILDDVKSYIYYKVRLIFNPPSNSFVVNSYKDAINETAWRICTTQDMKRNNEVDR